MICALIFGLLALTSLQDTAWAEYKPIDVSDIKGEQLRQLSELVESIKKMPPQSRDGFLCEQLGLCFATDGTTVMWREWRGPCTDSSKAFFVGRSGRPMFFDKHVRASPTWTACYRETSRMNQIKDGSVLSFFRKDIDRIVCNTAKYLLKEMPDITRYAMLASIGRMLYKEDGTTLPASGYGVKVKIGSGFDVNYNGDAGDGYFFMDSTGKERSLQQTFATDSRKADWRDIVRRCENLVGARNILALFPDEVKVMRKHYRKKLAQMKERKDATTKEDKDSGASHRNAMGGTSSDGAASPGDAQYAEGIAALRRMSTALRRAWLAESMGFCYTQSDAPAYMALHIANDDALFVDEQGKERKLSEVATDKMAPDWVAATKAALAVGYEQIATPFKEELKGLAVQTGTYILNKMPKEVRFSWLSETNKLLFQADGKPIYPSNRQSSTFGYVTSQRFKISYAGRLYYSPQGRIEQAQWPEWSIWGTRWCTLFRCENLVGIEAINNSFKEDVKAMRAAYEKSPFYNEEKELPDASQKTAMGSASLDGAASPRDAQYEEGIAALRRMSTGMRRAWLAENMGFCYTQSDAPAYMAPHIANDNALFVDEQGRERKLSEVATDKMAPDWVAATKAALAVGHEQFAAPFTEELKKLAVQTATHILNAIGETPRYSWLAEMNHLMFNPNGQSAYPPGGLTDSVESGFKIHSPNVNYGSNLYYNPQGKITQPSAGNAGLKRWAMLFRCANVAGIEAINAAFKADVDAMRSVYEKSPFYKK